LSDLPATLYYIHDPMCSWCWAYRPALLQLREHLPVGIEWQNVLGGLAADNDQPMPEKTREMIQGHWRKIESSLGTPFNFDFWTENQPRRDTYKACRAVIAASFQQAEEAMIECIQKAYYLRAMNPSDLSVLVELATELGLDRARFEVDLVSRRVESGLRQQLRLRDKLKVRSFPSLVFNQDSTYQLIPHDYQDYSQTLTRVKDLSYANAK